MVKILFLAANPADTARLRLDEESRAIDQALRQTEFRDQFVIERHGAVHIDDLQSLLLRYKPDIVHFSGHGSAAAEIILQDEQGRSRPVSGAALQRLFALLKENITCVVLNACYSESQANAIAKEIACVIGMSGAIGDESATKFAVAFYQALGYGKDIQTAFQLGRARVDLENLGEQDKPQLLAMKVNPAQITFSHDGRKSPFVRRVAGIGAIAILSSVFMFYVFGGGWANDGEQQTPITPIQAATTSQPAALPSASPTVAMESPAATTLPATATATNLIPATATPSVAQMPGNNVCPETMGFGDLIHCDLAAQGENHLYKFQATQGDQVYVKVINEQPDELLGLYLIVLAPNGATIFENSGKYGLEKVIPASGSGTYTLRVRGLQNAHTGKYVVYLQRLRDPAQAQTLTVEQPLRASIKSSFQHDVYVFEAAAGERVSIEVSESGALTLQVTIYGPDGNLEFANSGSDGVTVQLTRPSSATYLMIVHDFNYSHIGDYSIFRSQ